MLPEPVAALPDWLLAGVALGGLLAGGVAAAFLVGVRLFPDGPRREEGPSGGERRRRAEVRRYLAAIGEPFVEDHRIAGRPAAFYLPERHVAITFDARDYFRFEGAGVRAVLLEYEVPGSHLGSRLPFETPEPHPGQTTSGRDDDVPPRGRWDPSPSVTPAESAFAALGLPAGATRADVREAYREQVKDVHPDHGGDLDAFRRLREAYTVALNRAK